MAFTTCLYVRVFVLFSLVSLASSCPTSCACSGPVVDCYGRRLTEIPEGLPESTVQLDLQDNEISSVHASRLRPLTNLVTLKLRLNHLTEIGPETFVDLPKLKMLHLGSNDIEVVAENAFANLSSLQVLNLMNNQLSEVSGQFSTVPSLERLVLSLNKITELKEGAFTGLKDLQYLVLAKNQIGRISPKVLGDMPQLSYLVLRGNPLRGVDDIFTGIETLSYLDVSECQLTYVPRGLPWALRYLRISENNLTTIRSTDFSNNRYLGALSLDNNLITSIQDGALSMVPHLTEVRISHNQLYELPRIFPENIETFSADDNEISSVLQTNFPHNSKMKFLSLNNNKIGSLEANTFSRLGNLTSLYLGDNNIKVLKNMTFAGLRQVRSVSLDSNPLEKIELRALGGLPLLQQLKLSNVKTDVVIDGSFFRDVPSLVSLDLQNSPKVVKEIFTNVRLLRVLRNIKRLNLKTNGLKNLPSNVKVLLTSLKSLGISDNPWNCDENLLWMAKWIQTSARMFLGVGDIKCSSPDNLKGMAIKDINLDEFTMPTTTATTTTFSSTTQVASDTTDIVTSSLKQNATQKQSINISDEDNSAFSNDPESDKATTTTPTISPTSTAGTRLQTTDVKTQYTARTDTNSNKVFPSSMKTTSTPMPTVDLTKTTSLTTRSSSSSPGKTQMTNESTSSSATTQGTSKATATSTMPTAGPRGQSALSTSTQRMTTTAKQPPSSTSWVDSQTSTRNPTEASTASEAYGATTTTTMTTVDTATASPSTTTEKKTTSMTTVTTMTKSAQTQSSVGPQETVSITTTRRTPTSPSASTTENTTMSVTPAKTRTRNPNFRTSTVATAPAVTHASPRTSLRTSTNRAPPSAQSTPIVVHILTSTSPKITPTISPAPTAVRPSKQTSPKDRDREQKPDTKTGDTTKSNEKEPGNISPIASSHPPAKQPSPRTTPRPDSINTSGQPIDISGSSLTEDYESPMKAPQKVKNRQPTFSSKTDGGTKTIIIGVSVGLLCLVLGLFIAIIVVRHKRKQKRLALGNKTPNGNFETSDTVFIINNMDDAASSSEDVTHGNGIGTTGKKKKHNSDSSSKNLRKTSNSSSASKNKRNSSGVTRSGSHESTSVSFDCVQGTMDDDDSQLLMYPWPTSN